MKNRQDLVMIGGLRSPPVWYGFAVKEGSPLREEFNRGILYLKESGILTTLKDKWWGVESGNTDDHSAIKSLDTKLSYPYDKRMRPDNEVTIQVSIHMLRAYDWNNEDQSFKVDMYLRQKWVDTRVAGFSKERNYTMKGGYELLKQIWQPDTFFKSTPSVKLNKQVDDLNTFVRIENDGTVLTSSLVPVTVVCDLRHKNLKNKTCEIVIESYRFPVEEVNYQWRTDVSAIKHDQRMSEFGVKKVEAGLPENTTLFTGTYNRIKAIISLEK